MTSIPMASPTTRFSAQELAQVELFIRHQSGVVMRSCRMEIAHTPLPNAQGKWVSLFFPWKAVNGLKLQLETYRRGVALQLLLEKQLLEALTYLNGPNETTRDVFIKGAFKALYACEEYAFGDKASHHIQEIINQLDLQNC